MNQADPQSQAASGLESARLRLRTDIQWIAYQDTGRWLPSIRYRMLTITLAS